MRVVRLKKEVKISPKSVGIYHQLGVKTELLVPCIEIGFNIAGKVGGKLLITEEGLNSLKAGEKIQVQTAIQIKKKL